LLGTARKRDAFLRILNQVRERYQFWLVGYVVMPEHIHLLIAEPKVGTPSTVMQVLKQRVAQRLAGGPAFREASCRLSRVGAIEAWQQRMIPLR
jgi:putative transposase